MSLEGVGQPIRREPYGHAAESHIVQFYEDELFLVDTVARFLGAGIVGGESILVIATEAHRSAFCERLARRSINVEQARSSGQLILLDARTTLSAIMVGEQPDEQRFRRVIGGALDELGVAAERRSVRAYGEMVDLLWRDGNRDGALRLEELWNDLGRGQPLTLLCAYVMDNFYKESDGAQFAQICDLHTHTRPTERYADASDEVSRLREITLLQQRALALHNEVERRKKLESELRRSERRLNEFVEHAVVPLHFLGPDGTIQWANQAELDLFGYTRDEYVGHPIAEFHVDQRVIADILQRLSRYETLREVPSQLRCKDGSIRDVLIDSNVRIEDGKFGHTCCFTRDITARLKAEDTAHRLQSFIRAFATRRVAEEKFRESELRLRPLIDSIRDYAIFMLDANGHIATWNPGAQRTKGYEAAEIVGRHFSVFYPADEVNAGKCEHELRVAAETGRYEEEGWRIRKDGSRFMANVVISAVRDDEGQLIGFAEVTRDLTDSRRAEEERAALAVAEQANRAKDEFLAMLGHELRNPLAPIVTALQLMKLRGDVRSSKEQIIIERQVQHVVRLVDDLLDVSRITQGKIELKRQTFELADVVARAVEIASPLLEQRRHRFVVDVAREGLRIDADPVRLCQAIANLITNAAKYTEAEGEVTLTAWRDRHELVLQVKDNGVGIRPELLPRIFDLFVQGPRNADRAEGGLGIGLTLVRSLVQMHGGTVVALSDGTGRGSAFVIRLPAAASQPSEPSGGACPHDALKASQARRVLVVDDNADAAALLAELCETMGHEVRVAHDGPEALTLLAMFTPEVAVLDIGLPVMDGYELAKRIYGLLGASCRLIALTGYGQEHDRQRSRDSGFEAHLVKPADQNRILRMIDGPTEPRAT